MRRANSKKIPWAVGALVAVMMLGGCDLGPFIDDLQPARSEDAAGDSAEGPGPGEAEDDGQAAPDETPARAICCGRRD